MDCAPIVSSGCSPSVSIGAAVPVGTAPVGDVGLADVDGLGVVDCGGGGAGAFNRGCCIMLTVAPAQIDTALCVTPDCASCTIAKSSGMPAIVANDCLAVARGLIVEPK
eukprot:3300613-Amphidinium_carterae.1